MTTTRIWLSSLLLATSFPVSAQWADYPDRRTPRTKDGRPDLTAPAPRLHGTPDLSGVWQAERAPVAEFASVLGNDRANVQVDLNDVNKHYMSVFWGVKPETEPLRPEAAAILKHRLQSPTENPMTHCLPIGVPAVAFVYEFKMVQAPQEIVMLTETADPARQIYIDGRALPENPEPSWMGYSAGRWEGDTLVVETAGFTERSWLDGAGHPRSELMHITERYFRRDFGHLDLEVIFDDPKYYTRPFKLKTGFRLVPDSDVFEFVCTENEKDLAHMK